jgi:YidC/Oxa1 family membrane protein insertase
MIINFFKEISQIVKYLRAAKANPNITFYSESGIYYQNFRGPIEEIFSQSDFNILYITSDLSDIVWDLNDSRLMPFYINKLIPFIFPFINTKVLVMTMADLDKFHVKRSINKVNHIYMFHSTQSVHVQYNKGAFDCYDTIFCVGPHHVEEIRKTEEIYNLPPKLLINVGYSWLEDIEKKYQKSLLKRINSKMKILIAPTWSEGNILETCIETIIEKLLPLPYEIIVRPHPEFIKRQGERIKEIKDKYKNHANLFMETESSNSTNILESNILITDWSGIAIEYAWGMFKPVIYIDTPKKIHNQDYEKIGIVPLEDQIRELNGIVLKTSNCDSINVEIEKALQLKEEKRERLLNLRNKHIFNWGESSNVAADYIINYCNKN